ncbi:MAG: hypothetical protein JWR61_4556 [Ferruginibacter sp.]|uniref:DUF421 domain-containing protein n=1 Tax=Ferruginibacter sp. TaxID=1940288 RepID=UPI00265904CA|nr:YetF domain-containing protein [Ferruginibacter sp.]MDB5279601.1 hypothetical protein [Ferruginibacter sp.]
MELINHLFGKEDQLTTLQMCARGVLVFLTALIIMRIGSVRTFGKESAIDHVVMIILGGILSRVITGASPFVPVMASTFTIIILHRLLARICIYNHTIGDIIKGKKRVLYSNNKIIESNMKKVLVSEEDLKQGVRLELNEHDTKHVDEILIERNGEISIVKKTVIS